MTEAKFQVWAGEEEHLEQVTKEHLLASFDSAAEATEWWEETITDYAWNAIYDETQGELLSEWLCSPQSQKDPLIDMIRAALSALNGGGDSEMTDGRFWVFGGDFPKPATITRDDLVDTHNDEDDAMERARKLEWWYVYDAANARVCDRPAGETLPVGRITNEIQAAIEKARSGNGEEEATAPKQEPRDITPGPSQAVMVVTIDEDGSPDVRVHGMGAAREMVDCIVESVETAMKGEGA